MASHKALLIAVVAMAVVVGALLPTTASAEDYMVGNLDGWDLEVNYTKWVIDNSPFNAGDFLDFQYTPGTHDVVMLTSDDPGSDVLYRLCLVPNNAQPFVTGADRVQLPNVKMVYFFCGVANHCDSGMKFAINLDPSDG